MRVLRGLLSTVLLMSVVSAFADERPAPPHPTAILATYQGEPQPVVAVEKEDPVILVDGKRKRLRGNIPLSTRRELSYAGRRAEISGEKAEVLRVLATSSEYGAEAAKNTDGATVGGYVQYEATITAQQDLTDCFVALIGVDDDFLEGRSNQPNSQIRVRQIPDLRAQAPTPIKFSTTPFLSGKNMSVIALVFADGHEVASGRKSAIGAYFLRRERLLHAAATKQWLAENASTSVPAKPVQQVPPLLDSTEGLPKDGTATLWVAPDGTVVHVTLDREFPPRAEAILTNAFHAWLFLPRIENGIPVSTKVKLPLRF